MIIGICEVHNKKTRERVVVTVLIVITVRLQQYNGIPLRNSKVHPRVVQSQRSNDGVRVV